MQHNMTLSPIARDWLNPLNAVRRLHIRALEHAPEVVLAAAAITGLTRAWFIDPMFTVSAIAILALLIWHATQPQTVRVSARQVMLTAVLLFVLIALLGLDTAHASLGTMATSLKNDMGAGYQLLVYGAYGGGLASTCVGINNGIKKSKGDSQIGNGHVFGYGLGGPALGMVGYVMDNAAESLGGGAGQMGRLPSSVG